MPQPASLATLFQKKSADLSNGYYTRGARLDPTNRSRYNQRALTEPAALSMGIVQAILAVLSLHVGDFRYWQGGAIGSVWLWSTSQPGTGNDFSWDVSDLANPSCGGFVNGLTYQVVVLHLLWCILAERASSQPQSSEVVVRWQDLLASLEKRRFARGEEDGWSKRQVAAACQHPEVQPHIERVADALWFSIRYQLPNRNQDRMLTLVEKNLPAPRDWDTSGSGKHLLAASTFSQRVTLPRMSLRPTRMSQPLLTDATQRNALGNGEDGENRREKRLERASEGWVVPEGPDWLL